MTAARPPLIRCVEPRLQKPVPDIKRLRAIGWSTWDPIGLSKLSSVPLESIADEYDTYLLHAAGLLINGAGADATAGYLVDIATHHMGLGHTDALSAKRTADAINDYLAGLGYVVG
jgi:hypothetical protein